MHIQEPDQKAWIQQQVEGVHVEPTAAEKRRILGALNGAEAFERFLHTKFLGQKRFSLEGAETLIPMLDFLLDAAADAGVEEVVIGMAHRGRLNVLANIVGKSYEQIFREFEGELDPNVPQGSGDVKYHLGATGKFTRRVGRDDRHHARRQPEPPRSGRPGRRRHGARQAGPAAATRNHDRVLSVLIHGDAAFAGQGVVAETLNLSELPGYDVGGTVHIVVNNQVGFTTAPDFARSTVYATDIAKAVQAPIFHVNGDDPEAAVRVIRLAFEFRNAFKKDVVVDMVCYRRYGHNEGDEPAFTQPRMYEVIDEPPLGAQALHRAARQPRRPHRSKTPRRRSTTSAPGSKPRSSETHSSERPPASWSHRSAPEPTRDDRRRPACRANSSIAVVDRAHHVPRRLRAAPEARAHPRQPAHGVRRRPDRLGARRGARVRLARCSKARRCASPARTRAAARSASATRWSSTTAPSRSTRRSRTSATTPRRS